ncbi:MAG: saccharopine dehydrogenase NADP-binding domain-containing protein, partial [Bacteroidota bacterium]
MQFLLYGAYGYTGTLIAEMAADYGLTPVLSGRSEAKLKPLAERLGYAYRVCDLSDQGALDALLADFSVVLHAAGPFQYTAKPMLEACLRTKTHYLDITGEIEVFELAATYDKQAQAAGIMLLPGAGFDVVPTDCLALYLKEKMPTATHLQLAFSAMGKAGVSRGTAKTMAENLGELSTVRENGKLKKVPLGHKTLQVPFTDERSWFVVSIPWGDVSTAYYSTRIPNIETYMAYPPKQFWTIKYQKYLSWALKSSVVKNMAKRRIDKQAPGPSAALRAESDGLVWGRVRNVAGDTVKARLRTPNGYTLTAITSLMCTKKVLENNAP